MLQIPSHLEKQKEVTITKEEMISFETEIKEKYEDGKIPAPIHLSKDNDELLPGQAPLVVLVVSFSNAILLIFSHACYKVTTRQAE